MDRELQQPPGLREITWRRREIENSLCFPEVLLAYAAASAENEQPGPLLAASEIDRRQTIMQECIADLVPPVALRERSDRWWSEVKASDDFLDQLFETYFKRLELPNLMRKSDYHLLAEYGPESLISSDVRDVLDAIAAVAQHAHPMEE